MERSIEDQLSLDRMLFAKICNENGFKLDDVQLGLLDRYVAGLLEWNKKINLISRSNTGSIWFSHILHSILPLLFIDVPTDQHMLDLGSGGGLPGVPISILRPDLAMTHVDSVAKKALALEGIISDLGLKNRVVNSRVEALSTKGEFANSFDCVIARAVAPLSDLIMWSRPLVNHSHKGSSGPISKNLSTSPPALLALKGGDLEDEIKKAKTKTGVSDVTCIEMRLKGTEPPGLEDKKLLVVRL